VRIAVIGGGISGLTAAHLLVAGGQDVVLIDDAPEPGGLIGSERVDGFLCERGPQAVLDGSDEVRALIASAGLAARMVHALPASRNRSVYVAGKLRPFPASPPGLIKTNLLSARGKLRLLREPFVRRGGDEGESVFDFVARRFGAEAAQRIAGPALIGVYAGDAAVLSMRAAFPKLAALEQAHGSVLRGLFRGRKTGPTGRIGRPVSFPDGLGELPRGLAAALGRRRRAARARALEARAGGGWDVALEGEAGAPIEVERVVLATPAAATAALLEPHAPEAAAALRAIPHAPVAVVCLGFRAGRAQGEGSDLGIDLDSYGFVVARGEGISLLGCQYDSSVFPGRAPEGGVLLRALLGGTFDPALVDSDDAAIANQAVDGLRRVAGLRRDPDFVKIWRARPGIPQYDRAQLGRVRTVDDAVARLAGLSVIGHALRGVGLGACIQSTAASTAALARDIGA
jgi:oxygen-dependent protoporphyrinogen oxidase